MSKDTDKTAKKRKAQAEVVAPVAAEAAVTEHESAPDNGEKSKKKTKNDDNNEGKAAAAKKDKKKNKRKAEDDALPSPVAPAPAPAVVEADQPESKKARKEQAKPKSKPTKKEKENSTRSSQTDFLSNNKGAADFDKELDALFAAVPPPPPPPAVNPAVAPSSKKAGSSASASAPAATKKGARTNDADAEAEADEDVDMEDADEDDDEEEEDAQAGDDEEAEEDDEELSELGSEDYNVLYDDGDEEEEDAKTSLKATTKATQGEDDDSDVADEEEEGAEDDDDEEEEEEEEAESADEEPEEGKTELVHETLRKPQDKDKLSARREREGDEEPRELKDRRTVFLGNVVIDAVKSKSLQKALHRHIQSFSPVPGLLKVMTVRFRSVPFSVPTDSMDTEGTGAKKLNERTQAYKEASRLLDNEEGRAQGKVFLNANQKRKVAYITQELNSKAAAVNAYVTVQHPDPKVVRETFGDAAVESGAVTAPVLAALLAVCLNGSTFEGRHLRADVVTPMEPSDVVTAGLDKLKSPVDGSLLVVGNLHTSRGTNSKATVFVGNLDFETEEEELRGFFEKMVREERGRPPASQQIKIVPASSSSSKSDGGALLFGAVTSEQEGEWVQDVRLVRDKATQMGKGFGYVRFVDSACVEEVLALYEAEDAYMQALKSGRAARAPPAPKGSQKKKAADDDGEDELVSAASRDTYRRRFKFKSRPLRVSPCKNVTASALPPNAGGGRAGAGASSSQNGRDGGDRNRSTNARGGSSNRGSFQKGSSSAAPPRPTKHLEPNAAIAAPEFFLLSKEERGAVKRADPARNARRMEKKLASKTKGKGDGDEGGKARVKLAQGKSMKKAGGGQHRKGAGSGSGKKTKSSTSAGVRRRP
ncbi:hypothetical protein A4X06_0g1274 [Tilletia controversa]|uniref:RRM domain-containing protein n=1 Tax=Tilletia controversa TaxID=13291 RepID=A0A8X7MZW6_9BASI|nr:hypothetical protein CF328_g315 [Tilletia controversa]KAE8253693.1 hypothetical protein A4X06_0g1274 [Tilletia controversa]